MTPPRGDGGLDALSLTIGKLLAGIESLTKTAGEDRVAAATYRTDIRKEMKDQSGALSEIKSEVSTMRTDVDAMQRDVSDYRSNRDQAKGAAKLGSLLWTVLVATAGIVGAAVSALMQLLTARPHG